MVGTTVVISGGSVCDLASFLSSGVPENLKELTAAATGVPLQRTYVISVGCYVNGSTTVSNAWTGAALGQINSGNTPYARALEEFSEDVVRHLGAAGNVFSYFTSLSLLPVNGNLSDLGGCGVPSACPPLNTSASVSAAISARLAALYSSTSPSSPLGVACNLTANETLLGTSIVQGATPSGSSAPTASISFGATPSVSPSGTQAPSVSLSSSSSPTASMSASASPSTTQSPAVTPTSTRSPASTSSSSSTPTSVPSKTESSSVTALPLPPQFSVTPTPIPAAPSAGVSGLKIFGFVAAAFFVGLCCAGVGMWFVQHKKGPPTLPVGVGPKPGVPGEAPPPWSKNPLAAPLAPLPLADGPPLPPHLAAAALPPAFLSALAASNVRLSSDVHGGAGVGAYAPAPAPTSSTPSKPMPRLRPNSGVLAEDGSVTFSTETPGMYIRQNADGSMVKVRRLSDAREPMPSYITDSDSSPVREAPRSAAAPAAPHTKKKLQMRKAGAVRQPDGSTIYLTDDPRIVVRQTPDGKRTAVKLGAASSVPNQLQLAGAPTVASYSAAVAALLAPLPGSTPTKDSDAPSNKSDAISRVTAHEMSKVLPEESPGGRARRIVGANEAARQAWGMSSEEALKHASKLTTPSQKMPRRRSSSGSGRGLDKLDSASSRHVSRRLPAIVEGGSQPATPGGPGSLHGFPSTATLLIGAGGQHRMAKRSSFDGEELFGADDEVKWVG